MTFGLLELYWSVHWLGNGFSGVVRELILLIFLELQFLNVSFSMTDQSRCPVF